MTRPSPPPHEGFRAAEALSGFVAIVAGEGALWQLFPVAAVSDGWVTHVQLKDGGFADILDLKRHPAQPYASADDFTDRAAVRALCWRGWATHRDLINSIIHLRRSR